MNNTATPTTSRLNGREAVEYARVNDLTLAKYADPTEDAREGLSVEQAEAVLREDPSLIYLDVTAYQIDEAMCGADFNGDLGRVAEYLTDHGYPTMAITTSYNGASSNDPANEPPQALWLEALAYGEGSDDERP